MGGVKLKCDTTRVQFVCGYSRKDIGKRTRTACPGKLLKNINMSDALDLDPEKSKADRQTAAYLSPGEVILKCKDCGVLRPETIKRKTPIMRFQCRKCRKKPHKGEYEEVKPTSGRRRLDVLIERFIRESERCIAS